MTFPRALRQPASIIAALSPQRVATLRSCLLGATTGWIAVHSAMCLFTRSEGDCSCFPAIMRCGARA